MSNKTNKYYARIIAIQVFYSVKIDSKQGIEELVDYEINKSEHKVLKYKPFIETQIKESLDNEDSIKLIISKYLKAHRTINDIQPLLQSIMINALTEVFSDGETPRNILIDEYVEIASEFFDKKECGFVNAILDKYIKEYHSE